MTNKLKSNFKALFKSDGELYFSPGRINLIGEHIDYHGGYVLPAAISLGTYGVVSKRGDRIVNVYSEGFSEAPSSFSLDDITKTKNWLDYIKGVFVLLHQEGYVIPFGIDLYLYSTLPTGAGLSSSSSLELLLITMLNEMFNLKLTKNAAAKLGQRVENEYIGVKSGLMDQFAIAHGQKDHALFFDTERITFSYVPVLLGDHDLTIINTNKPRELITSKYNERYDESRAALRLLQANYAVNNLVDIAPQELAKIQAILKNELLYRRVKHVITEQNRTIKAFAALAKADLSTFGTLLYASHDSLAHDYEVTGAELDLIVNVAQTSGAVGARMTGAGFGGCALLLTKKSDTERIIRTIKAQYTATFKISPTFLRFTISDGAKKENEDEKN